MAEIAKSHYWDLMQIPFSEYKAQRRSKNKFLKFPPMIEVAGS